MPPKSKATTLTIEAAFSEPFWFQVPDYQRAYSWTQREAGQLLEDLQLALAEAQTATSTPRGHADEGYFLGTLLLMAHGRDAPDVELPVATPFMRHDIVDGQQRLVTITILLAILRDLTDDQGATIGNRLHNLVTRPSARAVADTCPIIELKGRDASFFSKYVQERGASAVMPDTEDLRDGEARLMEVREQLMEALIAHETDELIALANYLTQSCYFAIITSRSIDRAHRIFTVLNDRGRPLARNDILKAQILGAIETPHREIFTTSWDALEEQLGDRFEELFSHIRAIETRSRERVISSIAGLVQDCGGPENFLTQVLVPYAEILHAIDRARRSDTRSPTAVTQLLRYLGWFGSSDWVPAVMAAWRRFDGNAQKLEGFLRRYDRLIYMMRVVGLGADKRASRLLAVLNAITSGADLDQADGPLELSRDEQRTALHNLARLHARSQLACKLVLLRINDAFAGEPQGLDPANYTVEHVLPQKPSRTSAWRQAFPAADEREKCTHSLGNLVLITRDQNDKARNLDLAAKLGVYFRPGAHPLPVLTAELADATTWEASDILAREDKMMAAVRNIWQLDSPKTATAENAESLALWPRTQRRLRRRQA
jgi:hypothetical protein